MKFQRQNFSFPILKTFTMIGITTFALLSSNLQLLAQWSDDFSDENFTVNPTWEGDYTHFRIADQHLRSAAPAVAGTSFLSTASPSLLNTNWSFEITLAFNPSSSNFVRVYLAMDSNAPTQEMNSYFVMVGGSADDISLYRQTGAITTKIIDGLDKILDQASSTSRIHVSCDANGRWELAADVAGGGLISLGRVQDPPTFTSTYFAISCTYTATRSTSFSFDNFAIETGSDTQPPSITQVNFDGPSAIKIVFSEAVAHVDLINPAKFSIDHGVGNPALITPSGNNAAVLQFKSAFILGVKIVLSVSNIHDLAGNEMLAQTTELTYFDDSPANWKEVLITELMPDPSPPQGLPELEYIEIFNRSEKPLDLFGWTVSDGSSTSSLPKYILQPGAYLIIADSENASFGATLVLKNMPSLNNTSDMVMLKNGSGALIDSISYDLSWYRDNEKSSGGWSLEIIDPSNICSESQNWEASADSRGGTPGQSNSVQANNPDLTGPIIEAALPISENTLRLTFNETLSRAIPDHVQFVITPELTPETIRFTDASLRVIDLVFDSDLIPETRYTIRCAVEDCAGNLKESIIDFAVPSPVRPGDLLISEILFNPSSTGVDFIEIANTSRKYIDLSSLSIARIHNEALDQLQRLSARNILMGPSEYIVLTTSREVIESEYTHSRGKRMLEIKLPPFPDDEGHVVIVDSALTRIDEVDYSDSMHDGFLQNTEGVSLERVSFSVATSVPSNWKSSTRQSGYATPGYVNANFREGESSSTVTVTPESFEPLKGGFAQVQYSFQRNGLIGNAVVYAQDGRRVKILQQNELLGTSGFFRWDGDMQDGSLARIGLYQIWFEIYDHTGIVRTYRKRVAIAGDF